VLKARLSVIIKVLILPGLRIMLKIMKNARSSGILLLLTVLSTGVFCANAYAEACSYNEAILALKSGNETRGMALLNMAARDGDQRAVKYLASLQKDKSSNMLVSTELKPGQ